VTPPSAPPPPANPGGDGSFDLTVPASAYGRGFSAFIDFTVFGGGRPGTAARFSDFLFGTPTHVAGKAKAKTKHKRPSSLADVENPTHGALGASKTVTPGSPKPGSSWWWAYVAAGALAGLLLLLFGAFTFLRARRLPAN
jgi:hypothetical protein